MSISVEGADRLIGKLNAIPKEVRRETAEELREIGRDVLAKAAPLTPLDEGDLRGSQDYDVDENASSGPSLEAGYYGLPYIIPQHEGFWINFRGEYGFVKIEHYTEPGTGRKFLERPWLENKPLYKRGVAEAVERGIRA